MGDKTVHQTSDEAQIREFTKAVLNDLHAMEEMLRSGSLEPHARRIGAEQEMFLVDSSLHPAAYSEQAIAASGDPRLTTEIGQFNLEANLTPRELGGDCLRRMEQELEEVIGEVKHVMRQRRGEVVLCGILPTIQGSDLKEQNLTPQPRYAELNRVLTALHGDDRFVHIKGLDEIRLYHKDTFIEFCNTSFQVHLQPPIAEFTNAYNWAQAISAPVLAPAVNSPLLLAHRLWHETRLALFQHAVDERSQIHHERSRPARVTFGRSWVNDSIVEIFHEDVARFRIILTRDLEENSMETLRRGGVPRLKAWSMHNGTVWRWNRPCYGIMNGKPGLRIEARYLPAGPTILDEMANAAFFIGLMEALPREFGDVRMRMSFDDAKTNFFTVARYGLRSQITWLDGRSHSTPQLILDELLPLARQGLERAGIDGEDIGRYLGTLEERVEREMSGARWMLDSIARMDPAAKQNVRMRTLVAAMVENQNARLPLHEWPLATIRDRSEWIDNFRTVEQFMSRDLFTVRPGDVLDLAASLMEWKHVRHVPVEDDQGRLVGLISHRDLLSLLATERERAAGDLLVSDVMKTELATIPPETRTLDALYMMRERGIGCLPVCRDGKLVGMITAHDFLTVSTRLLEERLRQEELGPEPTSDELRAENAVGGQ
ncbi:MAG TPA: CBS domain-containing protein [Pyrinomonadaceae bacterium]|nr:CBS domain-containing protein [Pyrinomonadaceae bacterium]HMP64426.1 CBS domain-containing protein [Pyrinomonadaceae bacterium]